MNIIPSLFCTLSLLLIVQHLYAAALPLSDEPLAIQIEPAAPNVMLVVDDSRSMACTNSKNGSVCGDDMFYAPGYDPSKIYECQGTNGIIDADPNYVMSVHVSRVPAENRWWVLSHFKRAVSYEGVPYFRYTTKLQMANLVNSVGYYAWGKHPGTDAGFNAPEIPALDGVINPRHITSPRKCFNVNHSYRSYLRTSLAGAQFKYASIADPVGTPELQLSGNFLNWYFSNTLAEWKIKNSSGNYVMKDYSAKDGHWDSSVANNFIVGAKQYAWGRDWIVSGWTLRADNYVYPEKTSINGSTKNSEDKTWFPGFPVEENGYYVNINFLGSGHAISELEITGAFHGHGSAAINDLDTLQSMEGMKPGVYISQFRLNVAKDVAKTFVDKLQDANIGVSSFFSLVENKSGVYTTTAATGNGPDFNFKDLILNTSAGAKSPGELPGPGGTLVHAFAPVSVADPATSASNRTSLYNAIDMISGNHGTPTAETLVGVARYFFQGWEDERLDYVSVRNADGTAATTVNKKISEILPLALKNIADNSFPPVAYTTDKIITEDKFCRKNYMVVMTDGKPYYDWAYDGYNGTVGSETGLLSAYDPVGTTGEPAASFGQFSDRNNAAGLVRVPGALYDHDWLPSVNGVQNIETVFVRLGEATIGNEFYQAGLAASGGKSANFYHGNDGEALLDAINTISEKINNEEFPQSHTAIALSSVTKLKLTNYAFQASYLSHYWDSDLQAFLVNKDGQFIGNNTSHSSSQGVTPLWEAGEILAKMYIYNDADINGLDTTTLNKAGGFNARDIYSWNGSAGVKIIPNTFASLPADIQTDLNATTVGTPANVLKYLLGDVSYEIGAPGASSGIFRQRATYLDVDNDGLIEALTDGGLLGDAIHSSPVYVAEPPRTWDDKNYAVAGNKYSQFKQQQADRKPVVYIGTNAGFLHAFAVEAGSNASVQPAGGELFAYMPNMLASAVAEQGYHYLADPDYEHRYYVDLTATPSDVYMDFYALTGTVMAPEWRTILVGGLRKGGKGLFALDITCPYQTNSAGNTCDDEKFSQNNVLWEFSAADDADFGYSYGEPIIAKVNVTAGADDRNGAGKGRWAAIVSNGYNPSSSKAVLFILFLDGGLDGTWSLGTDYLKIDTNVASNGLSSATGVEFTKDGLIDRVYAGDLEGNLWSFNMQNNEVWSFATGHVNKLFTTSAGQPITTPPQVSRNAEHTAAEPNLMVMFGSGQYLNTADLSDKTLQTLYAVHDRGVYNRTSSDLAARSFDSIEVNGLLNRKIIESETYTPAKYGWYIPLQTDTDERSGFTSYQNDGERIVYRSFLVNNIWVFNSLLPNTEACGSNTSGWTMLIDWTTGLAPDFATYNADGSTPTGGNRGIDSADEGYVGFFNAVSASELGRGGDNAFFGISDTANQKSIDFGSADINKRLGWEEHFPHGRLQ